MDIAVNTRILAQPTTGFQRYLESIMKYCPVGVKPVCLKSDRRGIGGYAWEQFVLPAIMGNRLLWSPCNTGPLILKNQVVTIHDTAQLEHPEWLNPKYPLPVRLFMPRIGIPFLARRAKAIIAVSNFTKQRILAACRINEEKIHVVYNGVDTAHFRPCPHKVPQAKKELGIPTGSYFLAVGSLEPRKNLTRLIGAWENISNQVSKKIWLVITGTRSSNGIMEAQLAELAARRIYFAGHVPDELLPALYSGAIGTACVSLYEGFGLPALEAMACGSPVVTSNVSAIPEVVDNAALLVNPEDISEISRALFSLSQDASLRLRLRDLGIERANSFPWPRASRMTFDILQNQAAQIEADAK